MERGEEYVYVKPEHEMQLDNLEYAGALDGSGVVTVKAVNDIGYVVPWCAL